MREIEIDPVCTEAQTGDELIAEIRLLLWELHQHLPSSFYRRLLILLVSERQEIFARNFGAVLDLGAKLSDEDLNLAAGWQLD